MAADKVDAVPSIFAAVKSINTGVSAQPVGRDMDGLCTCPIDPAPCTMRKSSNPCDLNDGGIDNAVGTVLEKVRGLIPANDQLNESFAKGSDRGLLVRVDQYNGEPDDPSVSMGLYETVGLLALPPTWTVADKWKLDGTSTTGEEPGPGKPERRIPRVSSTVAYVRDGLLVAPIGDAKFRLSEAFEVTLTRAVFSARIKKSGTTFSLEEGLLTGTWSKDELFRAIRNLGSPGNSQVPLCETPLAVAEATKLICQHLDLLTDEQAPPDTNCNAGSFGIRFEMAPASVGPSQSLDAGTSRCKDVPLNCDGT